MKAILLFLCPEAILQRWQVFAVLFFCPLLSLSSHVQAQAISPYLFGQNAWEPSGLPKTKDQVASIAYQMIRIGGNGYENSAIIHKRAIDLIDYARSVGAEPVVQLPRQLKEGDKAYEAIAYINGQMGKKIRFWSIGNEPDHRNQYASPGEVSEYFKKISAGVKRYDPAAIIMGFDLASYATDYINPLLGGELDLTGKVPGKDYYYLDIVSFHGYRFVDITKFEEEVNDLLKRLEQCNKKRDVRHHLKWAITEFNTHWKVDPAADERFLPYTFHNGQIFAELYDLGMRKGAFTICPWSILEGGADREGTDLSMFDLEGGSYYPRSNFYHTQMLSLNRKKNYLAHRQNRSGLVVIPMGDKTGSSVMLINKHRDKAFDYTLLLHLDTLNKNEEVIFIDAKRRKSFRGSIPPFSTLMLVFDSRGKLVRQYDYSCSNEETSSRIAPAPAVKVFK